VGSSASCAAPMTVMNTIMAQQLKNFKADVDALMAGGTAKEEAIIKVLRRYIGESKAIRFEGDGYSNEWKEEAARRGLPNVPNSAQALGAYVSPKAVELFTSNGVLTDKELQAHFSVKLEKYIKDIQIEASLLREMVLTMVLPACVEYQNSLLQNIALQKEIGLDKDAYEAQLDIVEKISKHLNGAKKAIDRLHKAIHKAESAGGLHDEAIAFGLEVKPVFDEVRKHVDHLEQLMDDQQWPLPKMRELLFVR
jgi:glutamine synthetase